MKFKSLLIALYLPAMLFGSDFNTLWKSMQDGYEGLRDAKSYKYCHRVWLDKAHTIERYIKGGPVRNFLRHPEILGTMVRDGVGEMEKWEVSFINNLDANLRSLVCSYRDTDFPLLQLRPNTLNCSANTLGHLYYVAKSLECLKKNPSVVVEVGGGYGNLARIFTQLCPDCSYIILDLPEFSSIQGLFLNGSEPSLAVTRCTQLPSELKPGVYLMPVGSVNDLNVNASIFISTFGLSECNKDLQADIAQKAFFNAEMVYLAGGLEGKWQEGWVPHTYLLNEIKKRYQTVDFHGFPTIESHSYEMLATNR